VARFPPLLLPAPSGEKGLKLQGKGIDLSRNGERGERAASNAKAPSLREVAGEITIFRKEKKRRG